MKLEKLIRLIIVVLALAAGIFSQELKYIVFGAIALIAVDLYFKKKRQQPTLINDK